MKSFKWSSFIVIALLVVTGVFIMSRIYGRYKLNKYLVHKYSNFIDIESVKYRDLEVNMISNSISASASCNGIDFWIDLQSHSDNYVSQYTSSKYIETILSEELDAYISGIDIPYIEERQSALEIGRNDFMFFLEVRFKEDVDTIDSFINAIEIVLRKLEATNLNNCDTLQAFTHIGGKQIQSTISPLNNPDFETIKHSITEFQLEY